MASPSAFDGCTPRHFDQFLWILGIHRVPSRRCPSAVSGALLLRKGSVTLPVSRIGHSPGMGVSLGTGAARQ
jgi:hypothetical protein